MAVGEPLGGTSIGVNRHMCLGVCGACGRVSFQGPFTGVFRPFLAASTGSRDGEHTGDRLPGTSLRDSASESRPPARVQVQGGGLCALQPCGSEEGQTPAACPQDLSFRWLFHSPQLIVWAPHSPCLVTLAVPCDAIGRGLQASSPRSAM